MRNRNEFALEKMDDILKKSAVRISAVCIAAVMFAALAAKVIIEEKDFEPDLKLFDTIAIDPTVIINEHNKVCDGMVTVGIKDYRIENDMLYVNVYGENKTDQDISVTPDIFVLSSFNKAAAEPRYHYYAENWQDIVISAKGNYSCELAYNVSGINKKIGNSYIFTITAFRNVEDRDTIEIIINI